MLFGSARDDTHLKTDVDNVSRLLGIMMSRFEHHTLSLSTLSDTLSGEYSTALLVAMRNATATNCTHPFDSLLRTRHAPRVAYLAIARSGSQSVQKGLEELYHQHVPHDHECTMRDLEEAGATHVMVTVRHPAERIYSGIKRILEGIKLDIWSGRIFFQAFKGPGAANDYITALRLPHDPRHMLAMGLTLGDQRKDSYLKWMLPLYPFYLRGALRIAQLEYLCTDHLTADFNSVAERWQLNITLPEGAGEQHRSHSLVTPLDGANLAWLEAMYAADMKLWAEHCRNLGRSAI